MPKFHYKAKEGPSKIIDGWIEAETMDMAVNKIIALGKTPIDIIAQGATTDQPKPSSAKTFRPPLSFSNRISKSDIVLFTRQLADLVEAAVPLLYALEIVTQQTSRPRLRTIVEDLASRVRDGSSLSDALAQHQQIFSGFYANIVKTGELSGQLEVVLNRLADYLEKEQETASKIRSSLAYPAFILGVGVLTVAVLLTFVIPKLTEVFDDMGQQLPWPTVILIQVSHFFASFWWLILAIVIGLGIYARQWASGEQGRRSLDALILRLPLIGRLVQINEIGRFSRTMGTLASSGVVITTALRSVWTVVDNRVIREEVGRIAQAVVNGSSLKKALANCHFFPDLAVNMISVGEETGKLDKSFLKIADTYERQSERIVKTMLSLLGPAVLVVIVSIVGFVVIAMLLPIFEMNTMIQ